MNNIKVKEVYAYIFKSSAKLAYVSSLNNRNQPQKVMWKRQILSCNFDIFFFQEELEERFPL